MSKELTPQEAREIALKVMANAENARKESRSRDAAENVCQDCATLSAENEALKAELADYENPKHNIASVGGGAVAEMSKLKAQNERYVSLLQLILPMAKGYASEHRVGSNAKYIEEVEAELEAQQKPKANDAKA